MVEILRKLSDVEKAKAGIIKSLEKASLQTDASRVGFVSGMVLSEGRLRMVRNIAYLARYARFVKNRVDFPVFSVADFINKEGLVRLTSITKNSSCVKL